MINFSNKLLLKGQGSILFNSNWNPALHPHDSQNGEFIYTDGGLHGRSPSGSRGSNLAAKASERQTNAYPTVHSYLGIPPNSETFIAPNGQTFLAPRGTDFAKIFEAGKTNGAIGIIAAVTQYGTFDFQRNVGAGKLQYTTFYPAYTDASNYSVGVYMNGAGFNLWETVKISKTYAQMRSSNFGSPRQVSGGRMGGTQRKLFAKNKNTFYEPD